MNTPHFEKARKLLSNNNLIIWPRATGKSKFIIENAFLEMTLGKTIVIISSNKHSQELLKNYIIEHIKDRKKSHYLLPNDSYEDITITDNIVKSRESNGKIIFKIVSNNLSYIGQDFEMYVDEAILFEPRYLKKILDMKLINKTLIFSAPSSLKKNSTAKILKNLWHSKDWTSIRSDIYDTLDDLENIEELERIEQLIKNADNKNELFSEWP